VDIVDNAAGLADFTYMDRAGVLRLYEAGRTFRLPWVIAHAATKPELVAKRRPANWVPPTSAAASAVTARPQSLHSNVCTFGNPMGR
jgi:hypothetical protein